MEKSTRKRRVLSPETKWEIFVQVTAGEVAQADAARKWQVDVSTIIAMRRTAKDAALAAFARKPDQWSAARRRRKKGSRNRSSSAANPIEPASAIAVRPAGGIVASTFSRRTSRMMKWLR